MINIIDNDIAHAIHIWLSVGGYPPLISVIGIRHTRQVTGSGFKGVVKDTGVYCEFQMLKDDVTVNISE